ncbi:MAG: hypothetical protein U0V70_09570 [Terriglobia bacterium]
MLISSNNNQHKKHQGWGIPLSLAVMGIMCLWDMVSSYREWSLMAMFPVVLALYFEESSLMLPQEAKLSAIIIWSFSALFF